MNIFLHHRDLRIVDNTTLIHQCENENQNKNGIIPIFIFPPEQISSTINKYFSNNSVQFMIESLHELSNDIKKKDGKIYFFSGDTLKIIEEIHKKIGIKSIGWNIDYTPYSKKRDMILKNYCKKNGIIVYEKEDYLLYDILEGDTLKKNKTPYLVYTPFKNHCMNNLKVRKINNFKNFIFKKESQLERINGHITEESIDNFYSNNPEIHVHGGRSRGLAILSNISKFRDYDKRRDYFDYSTTFLSAYNHFTVISIREVFHTMVDKLGIQSNLINELHWRDFYSNVCHYFPKILEGQIGKRNRPFQEKYENLKCENNKKWFDAWCNGETGYPIVDAAMRQMNTTGFMHNRGRMITAIFLTKSMRIDFRLGEKYFAQKLVDYSAMQNSGGHQWSSGTGTDAMPYFRTMNYITQAKKYDKDCAYIKKWIPELKDVPINDILNWPDKCNYWIDEKKIKYYKPVLDQNIERKKMFEMYKNI